MSIYDLGKIEKSIEGYLAAMPMSEQRSVRKYLNEKTALEKIGIKRHWRILQSLKILRTQIPCDFVKLTKEQVLSLLFWIEKQKYTDNTKWTHEVILRNYLKWLGKKIDYIKGKRKIKKVEKPVLVEDEIIKLITASTYVRDKCLLAFLWESGCRIGEAGELKISDISFEKIGIRVNLFGKTGPRSILILSSSPYFKEWLNVHPTRNNPNSYVFVTMRKRGETTQLQYAAIRKLLQILAKKAGINKRINPHWFRHSRATDMARKQWSEASMRAYLGWGKDSDMPSTYIHLSGRDIDAALFRERGIPIEQNKITPAFRECLRCRQQNGIAELLCCRCGALLKIEEYEKVKAREKEEIKKMMFEVIKSTKI